MSYTYFRFCEIKNINKDCKLDQSPKIIETSFIQIQLTSFINVSIKKKGLSYTYFFNCARNSEKRKRGTKAGRWFWKHRAVTYRWDEGERGPVHGRRELSGALQHWTGHESSWKAKSKVGPRSRQVSSARDRLHGRNVQNSRTSVLHQSRGGRNESRHLTGTMEIQRIVHRVE